MPNDDISPLNTPTNKVYRHKVWFKGIDCASTYVWDRPQRVREKTPHNQCITTFGKGWITGIVSLQSVLMNAIRHVRDLCPSLTSWSSLISEEEILVSVDEAESQGNKVEEHQLFGKAPNGKDQLQDVMSLIRRSMGIMANAHQCRHKSDGVGCRHVSETITFGFFIRNRRAWHIQIQVSLQLDQIRVFDNHLILIKAMGKPAVKSLFLARLTLLSSEILIKMFRWFILFWKLCNICWVVCKTLDSVVIIQFFFACSTLILKRTICFLLSVFLQLPYFSTLGILDIASIPEV